MFLCNPGEPPDHPHPAPSVQRLPAFLVQGELISPVMFLFALSIRRERFGPKRRPVSSSFAGPNGWDRLRTAVPLFHVHIEQSQPAYRAPTAAYSLLAVGRLASACLAELSLGAVSKQTRSVGTTHQSRVLSKYFVLCHVAVTKLRETLSFRRRHIYSPGSLPLFSRR